MGDLDTIQRSILPIPEAQHVGLTTYDAKDPYTTSDREAPGLRAGVCASRHASGFAATERRSIPTHQAGAGIRRLLEVTPTLSQLHTARRQVRHIRMEAV